MTRKARQRLIDDLRTRAKRLPEHSRKRSAIYAKLIPLVCQEIRASIRDGNKDHARA